MDAGGDLKVQVPDGLWRRGRRSARSDHRRMDPPSRQSQRRTRRQPSAQPGTLFQRTFSQRNLRRRGSTSAPCAARHRGVRAGASTGIGPVPTGRSPECPADNDAAIFPRLPGSASRVHGALDPTPLHRPRRKSVTESSGFRRMCFVHALVVAPPGLRLLLTSRTLATRRSSGIRSCFF